jgi:hypothetical protein
VQISIQALIRAAHCSAIFEFFQKEALPAMQQGSNLPGEQRENKMGVMPVNKLILNMSLPIMISMLVQALYNVVDSVFVSRISENALTAVSLAFPVQNLMIRCVRAGRR